MTTDPNTTDPNVATISSEPAGLQAAADAIAKLRASFLLDIDDNLSVMAEPHFLIALAALDQAAANLRLASYHQAQANVGSRR